MNCIVRGRRIRRDRGDIVAARNCEPRGMRVPARVPKLQRAPWGGDDEVPRGGTQRAQRRCGGSGLEGVDNGGARPRRRGRIRRRNPRPESVHRRLDLDRREVDFADRVVGLREHTSSFEARRAAPRGVDRGDGPPQARQKAPGSVSGVGVSCAAAAAGDRGRSCREAPPSQHSLGPPREQQLSVGRERESANGRRMPV